MSLLKSVKTVITYKVPAWEFCNHVGHKGNPTKVLCRFCVKEGKGTHRCALYNMSLQVTDSIVVDKTGDCVRATAGYKCEVSDVPDIDPAPIVNPKDLMESTIDLYVKTKNSLRSQGYPEAIADTAARAFVMGGSQ